MMRAIRRLLVTTLFMIPTLFAAYWTCLPAASAYLATQTLRLPELLDEELADQTLALDLRRGIQKHFLQHTVYIPLEDIVTVTASDPAQAELALLMQKACGRGKLYVWVPLKFRLPVVGEKVSEWCWKPLTKTI